MFGRTVRFNYILMSISAILVFVVVILYYAMPSNTSEGDGREEPEAFYNAVPKTISLRKLLDVAIQAAQLGGEQVKIVKDLHIKSKGQTKEGVNDPVTDADLKSHTVIMKVIKNSFPDLEVVSEEHTDKANVILPSLPSKEFLNTEIAKLQDEDVSIDDVTVWVDPLDATKEFTENLLQYVTTMICVAVHGSPVIGVVHDPFQLETYWGWVDHGTSVNIQRVSPGNKTYEKTIIISMSHTGDAIEVGKKAFGEKTKFVEAAGAGYKVLQVIAGKADAYLHVTAIKKWDTCAGHALLNAVGGEMTTKDGEPLDYDVLSPEVNDKGLIATLRDHDSYVSALKAGV